MVSTRYRQYVLYYPGHTGEATSADEAGRARRLVAELTGCVRPSTVVVRLDAEGRRDAATLNAAMMTSYLDHLVDYYLVVFAGTPPSHTRYSVRRPASSWPTRRHK